MLQDEIMKPSFRLSDLLKYEDQSLYSDSPTKRKSLAPPKPLQKHIFDITNGAFQFIIGEFTQSIKKERVPIQKNLIKRINQYVENECQQLQVQQQLEKRIQQKIIEDLNLLVFALCHISKPIVDFLENHFIDYAEELQITIWEINLQLFQPKIVELIKKYIATSMNIVPGNLYSQLLEQAHQLICNLSFEVSDQICLILEECRGYIEPFIAKFRERNIPQILLNKYTILALFQELSQNCYQTIQDLLEFTIFHYAEPDIVEKFMKYAIENYDTLILKNKMLSNSTQQNENINKVTVDQVVDYLQQCITNKNKSIAVYKIQYRQKLQKQLSEDDEDQCTQSTDIKSFKMQKDTRYYLNGLYLESEDPQSKFIIYVMNEEFKVIYAPLVSKRWAFQKTFVIDQQEKDGFFKKDSNRKSGWGVYPVKFKSMKELIHSSWVHEQLALMILNQYQEDVYQLRRQVEGEMDTMFGSFLANVSRNKEFLQHFGENAVNNGCMQQLVVYMPLLKDFLNLGGFGAQALLTSQEIYTPQRTFTSTLAISTSLVSGAIIGQALIPIPFVGGIVGGIIGGYLGNKGMTNYTKSRNEKKSLEMVLKLQLNQLQDGHWECNKVNLDIMVINFKILNDHMPKVLSEDSDRQTKWINLVIFAVLSLFFNSNEMPGVWQECLDCLIKYIQIEKISLADTLENLKQIVEVIVKNL
ncbi:unnamed protein product [Paramecium pentaurelia]|uniref:Uncharacterized protein n=1 Tax=Paramecium pentaurelia TaxID=43138 RepID=A0A8S1UQB0_9CILI|nr:unnamed protein product [Paramecium pentaurelia]